MPGNCGLEGLGTHMCGIFEVANAPMYSKYVCNLRIYIYIHPVKTIADSSFAIPFLHLSLLSRHRLPPLTASSSACCSFLVSSHQSSFASSSSGGWRFPSRTEGRVGRLRHPKGRRLLPEWRLSRRGHSIGRPLVWCRALLQHWLPFSPLFFGIRLLRTSPCLLPAGDGRVPIHPFSIAAIRWLARAAALNRGVSRTTGAIIKVASAVPGISGAFIVPVIICPVLGSG
jgi:hypothetical protein